MYKLIYFSAAAQNYTIDPNSFRSNSLKNYIERRNSAKDLTKNNENI